MDQNGSEFHIEFFESIHGPCPKRYLKKYGLLQACGYSDGPQLVKLSFIKNVILGPIKNDMDFMEHKFFKDKLDTVQQKMFMTKKQYTTHLDMRNEPGDIFQYPKCKSICAKKPSERCLPRIDSKAQQFNITSNINFYVK